MTSDQYHIFQFVVLELPAELSSVIFFELLFLFIAQQVCK